MPKVTLPKWRKEIISWCPSLRLLVFYGEQHEKEAIKENELRAKQFDVVLTTFEVAMREKAALSRL